MKRSSSDLKTGSFDEDPLARDLLKLFGCRIQSRIAVPSINEILEDARELKSSEDCMASL